MTLNEIIFIVEDDPEGGYTARALGQSVFTESETLEEIESNIKDALKCHYDSGDEHIPSLLRLHIVKEEAFAYA